MKDFLDACISDLGVKNDHKAFTSTFCERCRNQECVHAKWAGDKFAARVATQPDRMLRPNMADPKDPKYARFSDFIDNLREAMRLEIADRRKDWEIPEIPILDGTEQQAPPIATAPLDMAAKALAQARGKDLNFPDPWEESVKAFIDETKQLMPEEESSVLDIALPTDEQEEVLPEPPRVVPTPPPRHKGSPGAIGNAPNKAGIMLGGTNPPQVPVVDDWEPKKKTETIQPGTRVKLGGTPEKGK